MKAMGGIIRFDAPSTFIFARRNKKFFKEKVSFENDDFLLHFDGVLLNSDQLMQTGEKDNMLVLLRLYRVFGAELVLQAKGLYSLAVWDKKEEKVLITNDLLSKRSMYYYCGKDAVYYASSYHDILHLMAEDGLTPEIRIEAVKSMAENGFLTGNQTYVKGVFCLGAFESIVIDRNSKKIQILHHSMRSYMIPDDEQQLLAQFDKLFSAAVDMQFRKNAAYGYKQCVTLSGGMDSRSCLLKAVRLGYDSDILCINYAQSGSLDYLIAQQIAKDLRLDYLFYPMDAAVFIDRLPEAMQCNECQQSGIGSTGARTMANLLDTENFGIINIGICGGELMGDLVRPAKAENSKLAKVKSLLRKKGKNQSDYVFDSEQLENHLRACQNFTYMFVDQCESISPFMDEDVFMFVSQLDPSVLYKRDLYQKWMMQYIPNPYIVTHLCAPLGSSSLYVLWNKVRYTVQKKLLGSNRREMNPVDRWFQEWPCCVSKCKEDYKMYCNELSKNPQIEGVLDIAKGNWGTNWLKNLYVLTALQGIKDISVVFKQDQ